MIWAQKKSQISRAYGIALAEEGPPTDFLHGLQNVIKTLLHSLPWNWHLLCKQDLLGSLTPSLS